MLHYKAEQNEADKNEHNTVSGEGVVSIRNTCGQGKRETSIAYTWVLISQKACTFISE